MGYLWPELIVAAAGLLITAAGAALPAGRTRPLAWLSAASLALATAVAGFQLRGSPSLPAWAAAVVAADGVAHLVRMVALVCTLVAVVFAVDFLADWQLEHRGEFYGLLLFSCLGIMLLASATDLVAIYLYLELVGITGYVLAGYFKRDVRSAEAGIKYFLVGATSSATMIYGMSLIYGLVGQTSLQALSKAVAEQGLATQPVGFVALVLLLVGFGFKIAMVPFHMWAPDTYEGAPTPITAFLSVGPKAAGFVVLLRVLLVGFPLENLAGRLPSWPHLLAGFSAVTMTLGNLLAIPQTNIKRMLAYSSIAQAGYILVGLAAAPESEFGLAGVLLYLVVYLFMNLGAFVVVIAASRATRSEEIESMRGLMGRAPWLAVSLAIFFLSLAGIPPLAGFWAKVYVFAAAIQAHMLWLALLGVANSVVSVYYYFSVVRVMFLHPPEREEAIRLTGALRVAVGVTLAATLIIGVAPDVLVTAVAQAGFAGSP